MIVNSTMEGWEIIFQRAHGVLAAQLAYHWKISHRPARWMETLLAIADHDDSQLEFRERRHLTPSGAPLSFDMKKVDLFQPSHNVSHASQKSRWIALLTSMHVDFLYKKISEGDGKLHEMLKEQEFLRAKILKEFNITEQEAIRSYHLLEWCDALSLLLCQDRILQEERKMEISIGPDNIRHFIWQRKIDNSLGVEPWCFEADEFEVSVEKRLLTQLTFKNDNQLLKELKKSKVDEKKWKFRRLDF